MPDARQDAEIRRFVSKEQGLLQTQLKNDNDYVMAFSMALRTLA